MTFRPVRSVDSALKVEVYDKDVGEVDDIQGSVVIQLRSLYDQKPVDRWFNLSTSTGNAEEGQLRLRLHLIWSRHHYYQMLLEECERKINKIRIELEELTKYIDLFERPFGILLYVEIDHDLLKRICGEETENYNHPLPTIPSFPKSFGNTMRMSIIANTVGNVIKGTFLSTTEFS